MNIHRKTFNLFSAAPMVALLIATSGSLIAAEKGSKKLLIFVLAGQSNMQGHAEVSTLAYLPKPAYVPTPEEWAMMTNGLERTIRLKSETSIREELLKDPENAKLDKKQLGELVAKALAAEVEKVRSEGYAEFKKRQADPARVARDKELAAIFTPNLTDQKVLDTTLSAKALKTAPEIATEWETKLGIPVGKHTYIAGYGGLNRAAEAGLATGPLSTGYGARPSAFGPEYAFGIMLEKNLDQPILIIKTAWGGKSIHYDFRSPSAGPYKPTVNEQGQMERWVAKKAIWDKFIADGGTAATMVQMEKDIKKIESDKRNLQAATAKLPKDQQAEGLAKVAEMNAKSKELRDKLVSPPGDAPSKDTSSFYWNEMIGFVRKVLADPKAYHPEYNAEAGFEVAGGVWFQGFNDQFDPEYYGNYSSNMVHFIQDLRKEVKQPKMPFVIGVLGTPAFREEALTNNVAKAQREAALSPELTGTVAAVESWPLTTPEVGIWRIKKDAIRGSGDAAAIKNAEEQWPLYGSNQGYHYDGSGRFFIRLGDEFATAMLKLMSKK